VSEGQVGLEIVQIKLGMVIGVFQGEVFFDEGFNLQNRA